MVKGYVNILKSAGLGGRTQIGEIGGLADITAAPVELDYVGVSFIVAH